MGIVRRSAGLGLASVALLCASVAILAQAASVGPQAAAERLFVAVFSLGSDVDEMVRVEHDRLLAICKSYSASCFSQHFPGKRQSVAVVHSSPSAASPVVAYVHAVLRPGNKHYGPFIIGLDVELASARGEFKPWMDTVGDWHYGIHVSGVRPRGKWVQLIQAPFPSQAWLSAESSSFAAYVQPIAGEILALQSVRATFPDGSRRRIPDGNYVIMRSSRTA
jgi:hypothetical protein